MVKKTPKFIIACIKNFPYVFFLKLFNIVIKINLFIIYHKLSDLILC